VVINNYIFWDIKSCSPLKVNRNFGGICRLHFQSRRSQAKNQNSACFLLHADLFDPDDKGDMKCRLTSNELHVVISLIFSRYVQFYECFSTVSPLSSLRMQDLILYREVVTFVDRFTMLHFTATGASPAAKRIQIFPTNQYRGVQKNVLTL
jgi:hypothetical protein